MSLAVLFEDNHVLAVAKPAGVPIVPDASGDASLFEEARTWIEQTYAKPGRAWLGVVHRLDRPVSGVVVFARTTKAASRLSRAFAQRAVRKTYRAACVGAVAGDAGVLEQRLWKDRAKNRVHVRPADDERAKSATTAWRVVARAPERVLLELEPRTGRSHQLRVACATLGAPIAGDLKYGAPAALPDRSIALHAARLELIHPVRRTPLVLEAVEPRNGPAGAVWRFPADSAGVG